MKSVFPKVLVVTPTGVAIAPATSVDLTPIAIFHVDDPMALATFQR